MTRPEWSRERLDVSLAASSTGPVHNSHGALKHSFNFRNCRLHPQLVAFQRRFRLLELPLPAIRLEFVRHTSMQACCNQECRTSKIPRIPSVIDAPQSCSFATIRRPKAENQCRTPTCPRRSGVDGCPVARQHLETDVPRAEVVNDVDEVAQVAPDRSSFQTMRVSPRRSALSAASSPGRASRRLAPGVHSTRPTAR